MSIGQRLPMYIAALGSLHRRVLGLDAAQLRERFEKLRWENGPTFEVYLADVEQVRKRGYAVDHDSYVEGVTTVSAAVLDRDDLPVMAISAVGFSGQLDKTAIKDLGNLLKARANRVSRALTGRAQGISVT